MINSEYTQHHEQVHTRERNPLNIARPYDVMSDEVNMLWDQYDANNELPLYQEAVLLRNEIERTIDDLIASDAITDNTWVNMYKDILLLVRATKPDVIDLTIQLPEVA